MEQRPASMSDAYRELQRINEAEEAERLEKMTPDVLKHPLYREAKSKIEVVLLMAKRGADSREIRDFLDPRPPFALPTKPGSGIRAKFGKSENTKFMELRLYSNGRWRDSVGDTYTTEGVMTQWRDHEVIDDEEVEG